MAQGYNEVLYGIYKYSPQYFFQVLVAEIICILLVVNDLIYKRSVLKKVKET